MCACRAVPSTTNSPLRVDTRHVLSADTAPLKSESSYDALWCDAFTCRGFLQGSLSGLDQAGSSIARALAAAIRCALRTHRCLRDVVGPPRECLRHVDL